MPKFSIIFLTYRCGGIDIMADSLANQTYKDFELIIIDDYVPDRSHEVRSYLESKGLKAKYIGSSKPKCFPEMPFNVNNATNTGILLSTGEIVCIYQDYQWLPPDFLQKLASKQTLFDSGHCVVIPANTYECYPSRNNKGLISVWSRDWKGIPENNGCVNTWRPWIPEEWEFAFIAYPWQALVNMNGFPEYLDCMPAYGYEPIKKWMDRSGYRPYTDKENFMHAINHREWDPPEIWHQAKRKAEKFVTCIERDNLFNLKKIERGKAYWMSTGDAIYLPFSKNSKVLEIGGGDIPMFRPNMDMRKLPTVDIVCNLEEKWPIDDESFDGIFGKFVIEHISWRKIPDFLSECYRILKPGGIVFMVGPNTLEQCKEIVKANKIALESNSMIFGGQEEPGWNEHKAAFSPEYAVEIFRRAGFERVDTKPWPGRIWTGAQTDMIMEAYKHPSVPYIKGDRWKWIRDHVHMADSILDIGCGPISCWEGRGYNAKTLDERDDFHPDIIAKAHQTGQLDKSFDTVVLGDILEHYADASQLLNEAIRLAKKRIIITVPWEANWSQNINPFTHHDHKVNYTPEILSKELTKHGFEFSVEEVTVDIETRDKIRKEHWSWVGAVIDLQKEKAKLGNWYQELDKKMESNYLQVDEKSFKPINLNIGSFTVMTKGQDWMNTDILDLAAYANQNGFQFAQFDARKGIPWPDNTVGIIIASHFLEHITRQEGANFLKECYRVLIPGGVIRLTTPDTAWIANVYDAYSVSSDLPEKDRDSIKKIFSFNEGVKNAEDECEAFWNLLTAGHVTAYDPESLIRKVSETGFAEVTKMKAGESRSEEIKADVKDMYPELSVYVEAIKPENINKGINILPEQREASLGLPTLKKQHSGADLRPMRVGIISTQFFGCPPKGYSGLEMICWDLCCGLSKLGLAVTLFAPEGSQAPPNGRLIATGPALQTTDVNWVKAEEDASKIYLQHTDTFDILHGNNWFGFEYLAKMKNPKIKVLHTHHGHLDPNYWMKNKPPFKLNFVAISKWMQSSYKNIGMNSEYAYNGIEIGKYPMKVKKTDKLLYVGRFDKFKQPHVAIEIAKKLGMKLDLVGGTFVQDKTYVEQIKSQCDGTQICFYPDVSQQEKIEFMQNAYCLLFPSAMGEPFGLVATEAMCCGTPVIALNDGAISEVVKDGVTGYICKTPNEMVEAIKKLDNIVSKPENCRQRVEDNFSREKMAERYVQLYERIISGDEW